ncbi:trypsin-like peptidase domain-containing protein [Salipiger sp. 1_MG-2023]|uniref:trypsin-like peptidase domain-containing protein n=1 Tax=Salipiger sp. 1_MG-2023 TaxID=3062665 RepID=UPI0026E37D05|nr:trypsin-like peptidase domain-containing protein [Salipiger sp. 1_MG-2023]MDO6584074.1 trypsin-like peptidase domain-containing protein [Salipiger sp. 1_MG-2023]
MLRIVIALALCLSVPALADVPQSQAQISLSFAPLVKQAAPAVVNIYASRLVQSRSPFAGDPLFGNIFRDFGARPQVQNSLGSGVILSADGIVVSNYHVVGQATDIRVVLNNGAEYGANLLLADEDSDLAILQLDGAQDMPYLPLRDSDTVEVGELVLAIGNPFGVGQTVSSGIVSGLARSGVATGNARGYFIQTDAPINPGNSGGALIDTAGRLIGVNTSIMTRSGGSNGVGFAIPAALVQQFVDQARAGGDRFLRPWAGISSQPVTSDISESLGMGLPTGVLISAVHPASPFAKAGLKVGDVILKVDGLPVNTPPEMLFRMSVRGIGHVADVDYLSGGAERSAQVEMIAAPETPARAAVTLGAREVLPGLSLSRINPAVETELGMSFTEDGVIVTDPGPYGTRIGLRPGDMLLAIGNGAVTAPSDVGPLLRKAAPNVTIILKRGTSRVSLRFRA